MSTAARSEAEIFGDYERYRLGQPLTPELAELREGPKQTLPALPVQAAPGEPLTRALSREDRVALREVLQAPGWEIFRRLQQRALRTHVESATTLSQEDPLGNSSEVAEAWAYVKIYRRALADMATLLEAEVAELAEQERSERGK